MPKNSTINVALLGKSFISAKVAEDINQSAKNIRILALITRNKDAASSQFAEENGIPEVLTLDEAKADERIDLVYIAAPNSEHANLAKSLMKAGKHVIVEKPMAITEEAIQDIMNVATEQKKFCMEALMYQCHPSTKHLLDLTEKYLGKLVYITAKYGSDIYTRENPLQGGAIRNLGCYPISLVRYIAKTEPIKLTQCSGTMDTTGQRDTIAQITLVFENGLKANIETSSLTKFCEFSITDENGKKLVAKTNPWMQDKLSKFELLDANENVIPIPDSDAQFFEEKLLYAHEFDIAAESIHAELFSPQERGVSWAHSLGNARVLEHWFAQVEQLTKAEKPDSSVEIAEAKNATKSLHIEQSIFQTKLGTSSNTIIDELEKGLTH